MLDKRIILYSEYIMSARDYYMLQQANHASPFNEFSPFEALRYAGLHQRTAVEKHVLAVLLKSPEVVCDKWIKGGQLSTNDADVSRAALLILLIHATTMISVMRSIKSYYDTADKANRWSQEILCRALRELEQWAS